MSNPDCRRSVIETLSILSSSERQLAYERNVPHVNVTNELLCMWFDDTYLPESSLFTKSFSTEELTALAAFDEFYDQQTELLPSPAVGVQDWLNSETWRQIMARAAETLSKLRP